jgi:hypothetical protein
MKMRQDAINAELDHLSDLGFTMEQFFSEHGPVVVEAITAMGENDEVTGWIEAYRARHSHHSFPFRAANCWDLRRQI